MMSGDNYNSDLINRAYLIAQKAGSAGRLSRIELAERLTRDGIPPDLADQAAMDTLQDVVETQEERRQATDPFRPVHLRFRRDRHGHLSHGPGLFRGHTKWHHQFRCCTDDRWAFPLKAK